MNKRISILVVLSLFLGFAVIAFANNGALDDFDAQYPSNTLGSSCTICHSTVPNLNFYGTALSGAGGTGGNIDPATFVAVEGDDSDADGFTNIQEINNGFFPGDPASHPGVTITITSPNGAEVIPSGSVFTISYEAPAEVTSVRVRYSLNGGVTWLPADGAPGTLPNTFDWNVPTPVKNSKKALVRVIGFNAANRRIAADRSDAVFTIEVISIATPAPAEIVPKGLPYLVTWTTNGTKSPPTAATVFYSFGASGIWKRALTAGEVADPLTSFNWAVPSPATGKNVKLRIVLKNGTVTVGKAVSQTFRVE